MVSGDREKVLPKMSSASLIVPRILPMISKRKPVRKRKIGQGSGDPEAGNGSP